MKKFSFAIFAIAALSISQQHAHSQEVCREILSYASRDESDESRSSSTAFSLYKEHCEGSSSRKSSSTNAGLDAVVKAIPVKFSFGTGSSEEKINAFCKKYSESGSASASETIKTSTVVREALGAFNQCISLASKGIYFSPSILKTQVSVDVRRGPDEVLIMGVKYRPDLLSCTVPNTEDSQETVSANEKTRKKLTGGTYPITCERIGKKEANGSTVYPDVDLSVITDRGALLLPIRADASLPTPWASEISERITKVEQSLKIDVETLKSVANSQESKINDLAGAFQRGGYTCNAPNHLPVGERTVNGRKVYVRWMANVFDGAIDDGGPLAGGDGMNIYCVFEDASKNTGSLGMCLTGEPCPWR